MSVVRVDLRPGTQPDTNAVRDALTAAGLPPEDVDVRDRVLHVRYHGDLTESEQNAVLIVLLELVFPPPPIPVPTGVEARLARLERLTHPFVPLP